MYKLRGHMSQERVGFIIIPAKGEINIIKMNRNEATNLYFEK